MRFVVAAALAVVLLSSTCVVAMDDIPNCMIAEHELLNCHTDPTDGNGEVTAESCVAPMVGTGEKACCAWLSEAGVCVENAGAFQEAAELDASLIPVDAKPKHSHVKAKPPQVNNDGIWDAPLKKRPALQKRPAIPTPEEASVAMDKIEPLSDDVREAMNTEALEKRARIAEEAAELDASLIPVDTEPKHSHVKAKPPQVNNDGIWDASLTKSPALENRPTLPTDGISTTPLKKRPALQKRPVLKPPQEASVMIDKIEPLSDDIREEMNTEALENRARIADVIQGVDVKVLRGSIVRRAGLEDSTSGSDSKSSVIVCVGCTIEN